MFNQPSITKKKSSDQFYFVQNQEINNNHKIASRYFKQFTLYKNKDDLSKSIQYSQNALDKSRQSNSTTDLAFCLRKHASIIIRNEGNSQRYTEAMKYLNQSIDIFNHAIMSRENFCKKNLAIIQTEKQRALHQMRKCAYELKDGILLEKTASELFGMQSTYEMNNYFIDSCDTLFHIAFAKQDYDLAHYYLEKIKIACSKDENRILTWQRHSSKITLAEIERDLHSKPYSELIQKKFITAENYFFKTLNARKKLFNLNKNAAISQQLIKDFVFLFNLRVQKCLLGLDVGTANPKEYVILSAKKVFNNQSIVTLEKILDEKITLMKKNSYLPLDYEYFTGVNSLKITTDQFNKIFGNKQSATQDIRTPDAQVEKEIVQVDHQNSKIKVQDTPEVTLEKDDIKINFYFFNFRPAYLKQPVALPQKTNVNHDGSKMTSPLSGSEKKSEGLFSPAPNDSDEQELKEAAFKLGCT